MAFPDVPVLHAETRLAKAVRAADASSGATPSGLPTGPELPGSLLMSSLIMGSWIRVNGFRFLDLSYLAGRPGQRQVSPNPEVAVAVLLVRPMAALAGMPCQV